MSEPTFSVYHKDKFGNTLNDIFNDDVDVERDDISYHLEGVNPDETFTSWDNLSEFLEEHDWSYYWEEENVENAPTYQLCSKDFCDDKIQTHSQERLNAARDRHHISKGH